MIDLTLLCIYYVPDTILGTADSMKKEMQKDTWPYTVYIPVGKMEIKQINM